MTDYIKREDAIEFVESLVSTMSVCINKDECVGMNSMKKRAIGALHDVPAADVRENVHAHWVRPTIINGRSFDILHCSACGGVPCGVDKSTKFCACCGAIMDGGDEQ